MEDVEENKFTEEEEKLLEKLKKNCKHDGREIDPEISAPIFHKLGKLYLGRSKTCSTISERLIRLIRSAALLNAALVRTSNNANDVKYDLKQLHRYLLERAEAERKDADLFHKADEVKRSVQELRSFVDKQLLEIPKVETDLSEDKMNEKKINKTEAIESLQNKITADYTQIMANLANDCEQIMGKAPCKFAIVGLGSLGRKEVTPFSNFNHAIVLDSKFDGKDKTISNYFRWYSIMFQIILINLGETVISSVLNTANSKFGSWFYDDVTKSGISFNGRFPWACDFCLGNQRLTTTKDGKTELIKFVSDMLGYLNSEENLNNVYHLDSTLTDTCYIYGDQSIYSKLESCVNGNVSMQNQSLTGKVLNQIKHILANFSIRSVLLKITDEGKCNVHKHVYCVTALLISALGRLNHISANSGFDIIRQLAEKTVISDFAKHTLMYSIAIACELRLRWYMINKKQQDEICTKDAIAIIGKTNAINYFQIAYALQCDISKRFDLKKGDYYSHPDLLNISIYLSFESNEELESCIKSFEPSSKEQRLLEFDKVLKMLTTNPSKSNSRLTPNTNINDNGKKVLSDHFFLIGQELLKMNKFTDAKEYLEKSLKIKEQISSDIAADEDMAITLHGIGRCLIKMNKHTEANNYLGKALKIKQAITSDITADNEVADTLYEVGRCLIAMKNLTDAKDYLEKALIIKQKLPSDMDTEKNMSDILHTIGRCLIDMNKPIEAKDALQKALKMKQQLPTDVASDYDEADTSYVIGRCLIEMDKLADAKVHFDKAVKIKEQLISHNLATKNDLAANLRDVGKYLYLTEKFADAKDYLEKALKIELEISSDVDTDMNVATCSWSIAQCLIKMNEPSDAINHLEKTLKILQQISHHEKNSKNSQKVDKQLSSVNVANNRFIAATLSEIGRCFFGMNKLIDAKEYWERTLEIQQQISSDVANDGEVALTLYDMGRCSYGMNKLIDAYDYLERALQIEQRISRDIDTDQNVAATMYEIGLCLIKMDRLSDAMNHLKQALIIKQRISCDVATDINVAVTLDQIGRCLIKVHKLSDAMTNLKRALEIKQRISSDLDTDQHVAFTLHGIGQCLIAMNKLADAKNCLDRALEIKQRISSDIATDENVAFTLHEVGRCLSKMYKLNDAKDYLERALEIKQRISSDLTIDQNVAATMVELGRCLIKVNRLSDAKHYLEKTLEINQRISSYIATDRHVAVTMMDLGRCLNKMNRLTDAKDYLEKTLEINQRISSDIATDHNVAITMLELGRCLIKMNKLNDAKDYLEKALEINQRISSDVATDRHVAVTKREIGRCVSKMNKFAHANNRWKKHYK